MIKSKSVKKILQDRQEMLESSKNYDDGEFLLWVDENVDEDYPTEFVISVWLTYHPYDKTFE